MKVALLQLNPTIGDFRLNTGHLISMYARACADGAELVVAPEMCLCGYPPRDLLQRPDFVDRNLRALEEAAATTGLVPLVAGYVARNPKRPGNPLLNAAALLHEGKVANRFCKSLLPSYDVFDEARYFEPAKTVAPFEFNGRRIAVTICEDIWNDEDFWPERLYVRDPVKELIGAGASLILNLSASPWHLGKEKSRLAMLEKVARDEQIPLVQVNSVGANDELIFDGHSAVFNAKGELAALGKGFEEQTLIVDVDAAPSIPPPSWPVPSELLFRGLSLGIRDYVRKCGFKSVLIGLSGGIDSAVTAALAVDALGKEHVMGVAMPSLFSSPGSLQDAAAVAHNLGIRFETVSIEHQVAAMEAQLAPLFAGLPRTEAEENIQSRMRGVILMALSNKFCSLVLTTGNKSELAVGYCTLYGDMCGALAVIADLFKTQVYELARWMNRDRIVIPEETITKAPSAELRPNQTDQDTLPPYEILDAILDAYVVQNVSKSDLMARGFPPALVNDIINKVTFNEYKRRQAAPGLKVSPRAFGMGRRIPIAQRFRT